MAVMWNIWKVRNAILFKGAFCSIPDLMWDIKLTAWKWSFIEDNSDSNYNFTNFFRRRYIVCPHFSWFGFSPDLFFPRVSFVSMVRVPLVLFSLIYLAYKKKKDIKKLVDEGV